MIAKEVKEIVAGMEVSEETKTKINEILDTYKPEDNVEDTIVDQILRMIDAEFDPNKLVEDAETIVKF